LRCLFEGHARVQHAAHGEPVPLPALEEEKKAPPAKKKAAPQKPRDDKAPKRTTKKPKGLEVHIKKKKKR